MYIIVSMKLIINRGILLYTYVLINNQATITYVDGGKLAVAVSYYCA